MKPYRPNRDPLPVGLAYFDGMRYHCYEAECYFIERAELVECGRIINPEAKYYLPILQCSSCGRYYFGIDTPIKPAEPRPAPRKQPQERPRQPEAQPGDIILPQLLTVS